MGILIDGINYEKLGTLTVGKYEFIILRKGEQILYVTERWVFQLTEKGIMLIEIAPGVDLEKDILNQMAFQPLISENLKEMDKRIFQEEKMNIKEEFLKKD